MEISSAMQLVCCSYCTGGSNGDILGWGMNHIGIMKVGSSSTTVTVPLWKQYLYTPSICSLSVHLGCQ